MPIAIMYADCVEITMVSHPFKSQKYYIFELYIFKGNMNNDNMNSDDYKVFDDSPDAESG